MGSFLLLFCYFSAPETRTDLCRDSGGNRGEPGSRIACKPGLARDRKAHAFFVKSEVPTEYELNARELKAVCKLVWSSAALRAASTT